jgi:hypothetical protein
MKEMETKECARCGFDWPLDIGYYDNPSAKDGKAALCIECRCTENRENYANRMSVPLSPQAEATRKLYEARFKAIEEAGLSIDRMGIAHQNKIDKVLKQKGLFGDALLYTYKEQAPVVINSRKFKGGNKPQNVCMR